LGLFYLVFILIRKQAFFVASTKQKTPLSAGYLSSAEKERAERIETALWAVSAKEPACRGGNEFI